MVGGRQVAVTGFRSFPGVSENPSERLLGFLGERPGRLPPGASLHLLETAYAAIHPARDAILADPPGVLVMTGYSARAQGFHLECRASDICAPDKPDARGHAPGAAGALPTILHNEAVDFGAVETSLSAAGFPCELSHDAGEYVCNHTYYTMLARIAEHGLPTRAIFVHIPAIAGTPLAETSASEMELARMAEGVALVARALSAQAG